MEVINSFALKYIRVDWTAKQSKTKTHSTAGFVTFVCTALTSFPEPLLRSAEKERGKRG